MSANSEPMKKLRALWKRHGLCSRCGGDRINKSWSLCGRCRKAANDWRAKRAIPPLTPSSQALH